MSIDLKKQSTFNFGNGMSVPHISKDRRYWLVRTDYGKFFDDFLINSYVAIGWDYLSKNDFIMDERNMLVSLDSIRTLISINETFNSSSPDSTIKAEITKTLNKIKYFVCDMSIGDIVIVPSKNSEYFLMGIISSDVQEVDNYAEKYQLEHPHSTIQPCPYKKRREVRWLKKLEKKKLDIYLTRALHTQHAVANMDEYASYINRNLFDNYILGDNFHSLLKTTSENSLSLGDLHFIISMYVENIEFLAKTYNIPITPDDIDIKINIHSPGIAEFVTDLSQLSLLGEEGLQVAIPLLIAWKGPDLVRDIASTAKDIYATYKHEETECKRIDSEERRHNKDYQLKMKELEAKLGIKTPNLSESEGLSDDDNNKQNKQ